MRAHYHQNLDPPAPVVEVSFENPLTREVSSVYCLLDTGAYACHLPGSVINSIGQTDYEPCEIEVVGGGIIGTRSHFLSVTFCGKDMGELEVVELPEGDDQPLLGRDVLNQFVVTLNGPELTCEIT